MDLERVFRETGAILEGHFVLTSGLHSQVYWEKFRILQHPGLTGELCRLIADHYRGAGVDLVAGPTTGGIILAYEVARQLGVRGIFAEREGEGRVFRRGFSVSTGERAVVVDDIMTTGGSLLQVMAEVKRWGGQVVGAAVLADRSWQKVDLGVPLFGLHRIALPVYPAGDCPLCHRGVPLEKPGSG